MAMYSQITIVGDSHARGIAKLLKWFERHNLIQIESTVKPSAKFDEIVLQPNLYKNDNKGECIVIIAGANDVYKGCLSELKNKITFSVETLKYNQIILGGIPFRWDIPLAHKSNEYIMNFNLFVYELSCSMNNTTFLDLACPERCMSSLGIHINHIGKRLLCNRIQRILFPNKHMQIEELNKNKKQFEKIHKNIAISEINMKHGIDQFCGDKATVFAHCISADISCHRNMSAGVVVTFQNCFGKPSASNFEESHLTYQKEYNTTTVYGLVTKAKYYQKPTLEDYDIAFRQMTENFVKQKWRSWYVLRWGVSEIKYLWNTLPLT